MPSYHNEEMLTLRRLLRLVEKNPTKHALGSFNGGGAKILEGDSDAG